MSQPPTGLVKLALKREEGYPVGVPAPLYVDCICGHHVRMAEWGAICFHCRREYDTRGWIIAFQGKP